uniref:Uncharacterized protein n=1 Tax=Anopheles dirus TaxID=7168 RepID=A0A182NNP5_9DIPT
MALKWIKFADVIRVHVTTERAAMTMDVTTVAIMRCWNTERNAAMIIEMIDLMKCHMKTAVRMVVMSGTRITVRNAGRNVVKIVVKIAVKIVVKIAERIAGRTVERIAERIVVKNVARTAMRSTLTVKIIANTICETIGLMSVTKNVELIVVRIVGKSDVTTARNAVKRDMNLHPSRRFGSKRPLFLITTAIELDHAR